MVTVGALRGIKVNKPEVGCFKNRLHYKKVITSEYLHYKKTKQIQSTN